jgi:hypothetical protein
MSTYGIDFIRVICYYLQSGTNEVFFFPTPAMTDSSIYLFIIDIQQFYQIFLQLHIIIR